MGRWFEDWFGAKNAEDHRSKCKTEQPDEFDELQSKAGNNAKAGDFPKLEPTDVDVPKEVEVPLEKRFRHTLHKGGLDDILANQRLKVNDGNRQIAGGSEAVNAVRATVDMETLRARMRDLPEHLREKYAKDVVIEFTTDVPCPYHPIYARWTTLGGQVESGGYLPIRVLGVYDGLGNPLPMKDGRRGGADLGGE
jgi:hypothetical protein